MWANTGGDPSNHNAMGRSWYFILNWQNSFDFIPDNPESLPSLKTDVTSDATTIKTAALQALQHAYSAWKVVVVEGTPNTGDHQAIVETNLPVNACGVTAGSLSTSSLSYECNMEQAQFALQVVINNAQDETAALANQALIQAIGRGVGSNSAHEIAHQFLSACCSMDALTSKDSNAAGTYNNGDADGDPSPNVVNSDPSPYTGYAKDKITPIQWEADTLNALNACIQSGFTSFGNESCAAKLNLSKVLPRSGTTEIWAKRIVLSDANLELPPPTRAIIQNLNLLRGDAR
jgi:hypothetical protein